jgi:hypothetical protein
MKPMGVKSGHSPRGPSLFDCIDSVLSLKVIFTSYPKETGIITELIKRKHNPNVRDFILSCLTSLY